MDYETIRYLKDTEFKRLTDVEREIFEQLFEIVARLWEITKIELNRLVAVDFDILAEYQTEVHNAQSYGVSEQSAEYPHLP
ncbi:MAG TPA: hypothetical protein DCX54_09065 [Flavobacteriales bacterium]|nr:hypothetical protein [Flavobacteriales bacterium]